MNKGALHIDWIRDNMSVDRYDALHGYRVSFHHDSHEYSASAIDKDLEVAERLLVDQISHDGYTIIGQGGADLPDSGQRRQFDSGAVRDMAEGKGRCDLLPLHVVADLHRDSRKDRVSAHIFDALADFQSFGDVSFLKKALEAFTSRYFDTAIGIGSGYTYEKALANMLLETAKHFEAGAKKYDDNNWQKGIPASVYVDSGTRHYLKLLRGDTDEPHDRAVCWNLICAIWTCENKPELNGYKEGSE